MYDNLMYNVVLDILKIRFKIIDLRLHHISISYYDGREWSGFLVRLESDCIVVTEKYGHLMLRVKYEEADRLCELIFEHFKLT